MINRARLLAEFEKLTAFDSESLEEREIAEYLIRKLVNLGLTVQTDHAGETLTGSDKSAGNIYGRLEGTVPGDAVLFSAHMDTVSPGKGKRVIISEEGRVTSDGKTVLGSDDVTGIAAILEMLTVIQEQGLPHPEIEVVFFVAEELYCRGSSLFDFSQLHSKYAYVLDLDGAIGKFANEAPSIVQFTIQVEGKSAHAGFEPEKGISAILVAAAALGRVKLGRIDRNTTANIGTIKGGTGRNIIPGTAILEGEVRSLSNDRALQVVQNIKRTFEDAAEEHGTVITFESREMVRAYRVDPDAEVIRRYKEACRRNGIEETTMVTTFGGSDNNNFNKYGIEGIVITNAMNKVHTVDEFFTVGEFEKSARIVLELAMY